MPPRPKVKPVSRAAVAVVAVALTAGLAWVWARQRPVEDPNRLTLYGNVDIRQVALAFNASDRIASLSAGEGDKVAVGQVLFRRGDACRLIKRCNDFGAGGVSVAIGELADGLYIDRKSVV